MKFLVIKSYNDYNKPFLKAYKEVCFGLYFRPFVIPYAYGFPPGLNHSEDVLIKALKESIIRKLKVDKEGRLKDEVLFTLEYDDASKTFRES
jgi:hypothetical protein